MPERGKHFEGSLEGQRPSDDKGHTLSQIGQRVALVIGNGAYEQAPLKNPRNDAEAFAAKLEAMKPAFDVTLALDVGRDAMEDALSRFEEKTKDCKAALIYFAGHGLQVKGVNYLMPVDAEIHQETHLRRRAFSLDEILEIVGARPEVTNLVFLDACRDNPFARSLLIGLPQDQKGRFLPRPGLAEVRAGSNAFISFATDPDNVALDGAGDNSPYTAALLTHMVTKGVSVNDIMIAVRREVLKETEGRQQPWDQSSLHDHFYFNSEVEPVTEPTEAPRDAGFTPSEEELYESSALQYWEAMKGDATPARLREFIANYGTSRMGPFARDALQTLATDSWSKLQTKDESALKGFIDDYPGTDEIVKAREILTKLQTSVVDQERIKKYQELALKQKENLAVQQATRATSLIPKTERLTNIGFEVFAWIKENTKLAVYLVLSPFIFFFGYLGLQLIFDGSDHLSSLDQQKSPSKKTSVTTGKPKDKVQARTVIKPRIVKGIRSNWSNGEMFQEYAGFPILKVLTGGQFYMGSKTGEENEQPIRRRSVARFAIGAHEVTRKEWSACVADGYCRSKKGTHSNLETVKTTETTPITGITWYEVSESPKSYINWLNSKVDGKPYRLPSEAEWEFAARAGTDTNYYWGNQWAAVMANGGGSGDILPVMVYEANALGLYDMHGNVAEFVSDCWHPNYEAAPLDGISWRRENNGDCTLAVTRGGAWDDFSYALRVSNRGTIPRHIASERIGFRIARTLPVSPP